jgi:hypothetical protein
MGGETSRSPRRGLWDTGLGRAKKKSLELAYLVIDSFNCCTEEKLCLVAHCASWHATVGGKHTPKPVTRTVISSSWDGSSWGFDPMISKWSRREGEVERRRGCGNLMLDRGEVVRLFLGSVAGAGLCSSPQWAHCREICRRLLRFSFPSTTESGRPHFDLSPLTF